MWSRSEGTIYGVVDSVDDPSDFEFDYYYSVSNEWDQFAFVDVSLFSHIRDKDHVANNNLLIVHLSILVVVVVSAVVVVVVAAAVATVAVATVAVAAAAAAAAAPTS